MTSGMPPRHARAGSRGVLVAGACGIVAMSMLAGTVRAQDVRTVVRGTVYDSLNRRPLAGAMVQVVRAENPAVSRTATTGADGRFELDSVGAGDWVVGFIHPLLDSLGLVSPLVRVVVRESTPVRAMLAIPSAAGIVRGTCGTDSTGLWLGRVRSALTGATVTGMTVAAQWTAIVARGNTIAQQTRTVSGTSEDEGLFALCHMPVDEVIRARAWRDADSSGVLSFTLPPSRLFRRDVYVAPANLARRLVAGDSMGADTATLDVRVGEGRVRGQVRRRNGAPIGGARVTFLENGAQAASNANGFFSLDSLPLGTHTLDVRAIGFLPVAHTIDVVASGIAATEVTLESRAAYLDTVRVRAERLYDPSYDRFLQNKRRGFGYFYDEEAIERRNPLFVADLLRMTPGVMVLPGGFGGQVRMRGSSFSSPYCSPTVFLDGTRLSPMDDLGLDALVSAQDIRAMEVYTRQGSMPMEYQTMTGCGSIVIWTGTRRRILPP